MLANGVTDKGEACPFMENDPNSDSSWFIARTPARAHATPRAQSVRVDNGSTLLNGRKDGRTRTDPKEGRK